MTLLKQFQAQQLLQGVSFIATLSTAAVAGYPGG
jgi:hypothetical protein